MPIELDMSIEETIEHLEWIANNQFECADRIDELHCDSTSTRNMASYHKRLAEWLRELKAYREARQELEDRHAVGTLDLIDRYIGGGKR